MCDPRGLIRESYNIEDIDLPQCRAIFLDWALETSDPETAKTDMQTLLARYQTKFPEHPMTSVLREGAEGLLPKNSGQRSGRRRRS